MSESFKTVWVFHFLFFIWFCSHVLHRNVSHSRHLWSPGVPLQVSHVMASFLWNVLKKLTKYIFVKSTTNVSKDSSVTSHFLLHCGQNSTFFFITFGRHVEQNVWRLGRTIGRWTSSSNWVLHSWQTRNSSLIAHLLSISSFVDILVCLNIKRKLIKIELRNNSFVFEKLQKIIFFLK
jgi:hypothetical protein